MQKHDRVEGKRFSAKDYLFSELRKLTNNTSKDGRSRSRSIFTSHHGNIVDERCGREIKFLSGSSSVPNTSASSSWLPRGIYKGFYDEPPFGNTFPVADNWRDADLVETTKYGAGVTSNGIISLRLHDKIRIDMTLDRALRIVNRKNNIVIAISSTGSSAALLHPNGRVYQYGSRVEILAYDPHGNNKFAKMWYKGVSFTSVQCALVYLVDSAGTRTTTDTFSDLLNQDYSMQVFYTDARYGQNHVQEALSVLQGCHYWVSEDMTDNWIINNVRISQTSDGLVRVFYSLGRNSNKFTLRTSPTNGSASLSSPFLHCTGSMGQTRHLFVRRGERRMHYDGTSFIVRNAGHSAGFDDKHQLKVY